jgi:hypothetical protein
MLSLWEMQSRISRKLLKTDKKLFHIRTQVRAVSDKSKFGQSVSQSVSQSTTVIP